MSEEKDPSHSKVIYLNKVTLLSDGDSWSLVTPSSVSASEFCLGKVAQLPGKW